MKSALKRYRDKFGKIPYIVLDDLTPRHRARVEFALKDAIKRGSELSQPEQGSLERSRIRGV